MRSYNSGETTNFLRLVQDKQQFGQVIKTSQTKQWFRFAMMEAEKNGAKQSKVQFQVLKRMILTHIDPYWPVICEPRSRLSSPGFVAMVVSSTSAWWSAMGLWAGGSLPRLREGQEEIPWIHWCWMLDVGLVAIRHTWTLWGFVDPSPSESR